MLLIGTTCLLFQPRNSQLNNRFSCKAILVLIIPVYSAVFRDCAFILTSTLLQTVLIRGKIQSANAHAYMRAHTRTHAHMDAVDNEGRESLS